MRLLVITQYFWPENFRINDLVAELVCRGHQVTVLTGKPNYPVGETFPEFLAQPQCFNEFAGARIVRVPMLSRGRSKLSLLLNYASYAVSAMVIGAWRLRKLSFDTIFVFEPSPVTVGLPAILLGSRKGCPVAFWVLDQWPETLSAVGIVKSPRILRLIGRLVAFIYQHCDLVLAQSKSLMESIRKYSGHTPVAYFPSWAEAAFGVRDAVPADGIPDGEGTFSVMFAGNVGESQDFPTILDSAEQLREHPIRWLIVGDGRMSDWVAAEVERRGLRDRVLLLGRHPMELMPSFYRHADTLLLSLKAEPIFSMILPGKIQSYLAAGIPILGMVNGEGARIIEEAAAGFACPAGDHAALSAAVLRMSQLSSDERQAMGERGSAYSEREFNRGGLVSNLEQWLQWLAKGRLAKKE